MALNTRAVTHRPPAAASASRAQYFRCLRCQGRAYLWMLAINAIILWHAEKKDGGSHEEWHQSLGPSASDLELLKRAPIYHPPAPYSAKSSSPTCMVRQQRSLPPAQAFTLPRPTLSWHMSFMPVCFCLSRARAVTGTKHTCARSAGGRLRQELDPPQGLLSEA